MDGVRDIFSCVLKCHQIFKKIVVNSFFRLGRIV